MSTINRLFIFIFLTTLIFGIPKISLADSIGCDDAYVQFDIDKMRIDVAATGIDDTENIQCALDQAVAMQAPKIRLTAADFSISKLHVEKFRGTLEGEKIATTTINIIDHSIECSKIRFDVGLHPAAIKFIGGEPKIKNLTIRAGQACVTARPLWAILHFTGKPQQSVDCADHVIFASVNRVEIYGLGTENQPKYAVLINPENSFYRNIKNNCIDRLLGTFNLNQSKLSTTEIGFKTEMYAGAQVSASFTDFVDLRIAVRISDTNQNTTIFKNKFLYENEPLSPFTNAISSTTASWRKEKGNRLFISGNTFTVSPQISEHQGFIRMIDLSNIGVTSYSTTVISNNQFNLIQGTGTAIFGTRVSNVHVSSNRFKGPGSGGIHIGSIHPITDPVTNWTIVGNSGIPGVAGSYNIYLAEETTSIFIGKGQIANVIDLGTDNIILQ